MNQGNRISQLQPDHRWTEATCVLRVDHINSSNSRSYRSSHDMSAEHLQDILISPPIVSHWGSIVLPVSALEPNGAAERLEEICLPRPRLPRGKIGRLRIMRSPWPDWNQVNGINTFHPPYRVGIRVTGAMWTDLGRQNAACRLRRTWSDFETLARADERPFSMVAS